MNSSATSVINEGAGTGATRSPLGKQPILDKTMLGIQAGDNLAIRTIWLAAEAQVKAERPELKGPQYMEAVAELAETVVNNTQPVFDVLHLSGLGMDQVAAYEAELLWTATERLQAIEGLQIIGTAPNKAGVISFNLEGIHPHDIGTIIDHHGVAIRTGHHCAMPAIAHFGLPATARASLGIYNTVKDVDRLVDALLQTKEMFS